MSAAPSVETLSNEDLVEQFSNMVRWWHYDPAGRAQPSSFALEDLHEEIHRRLNSMGETSGCD